ncbi:hypothetical protein [Nocardia acidivorans]|uniref:hypothetical protein n=1 Tax=Nocardia acidivorans TaxID=404580 RepID=UPI000829CC65|nr:hypothetical protein [Nocardia acidivorans]
MYGTRGHRLTATALAALLSLALAACGGDTEKSGGTTTTGSTITSADPAPTEAPQGQLGRDFTADPGIVNPHPLPFDSWTRLADDKLAINFTTGSPECYGVDATVTETTESVTVALRSGTRADAVGRMCTMIAVFGSMQIQLKAPLGNREVLSAK